MINLQRDVISDQCEERISGSFTDFSRRRTGAEFNLGVVRREDADNKSHTS
jgi:hypothetical protein